MKTNHLDEASAARQTVSSPIVSSPPYSPSTPYQNSATASSAMPLKAGPAPIIRTLKAELFTTINGVETFTPCAINSREVRLKSFRISMDSELTVILPFYLHKLTGNSFRN